MPWVDPVAPQTYPRHLQNPELQIDAPRRHFSAVVVIDEVQKLPALSPPWIWHIEHRGVHFALWGSSFGRLAAGKPTSTDGERREVRGLSAMEVGSGMVWFDC